MYPHGYLDIKVLINPCHALQKARIFGCSLPRYQALRVTTAIGPISSPQVSCAEQPAPAGPKFCMTLKADTLSCVPASRESRSLSNGEAAAAERERNENEGTGLFGSEGMLFCRRDK
jgi:hypothetical protein